MLYAVLYHISLFFVGGIFGHYLRPHEGEAWMKLFKLLCHYFCYPAAFFFLYFAGVSFFKNRENYTTKSFAIFGLIQLVPFAGYWILSQVTDTSRHPTFKLILFICTAVICVNYQICAIITHKEYKALKYKTYPSQE